MNLDSLNLFADVMRYGNFADVARQHRIAASSVSRSIAKLEREIGVRLFQRSTRRLTPTEAAAVFFHRINPALKEIEAARQVAVDVNKRPGGNLRITAPAVFANSAIVPLLPELTAAYPQLSIELLISDSYPDLLEERIDIAIRLGSLQDSSYVAKRLADMSYYVCASPAYLQASGRPNDPGDIAQHRCLLFPHGAHKLDWLFRDTSGSISQVAIDGRLLITQSESIRRCAIAGMGLALLPDWLVRDALDSGELLRLFEDYNVSATDFDSAVWMLYPSRSYLPLKTRVFIDFLAQRFAKG